MEPLLIDHLFRHHYGKMVSVLTRIFGLSHLETIEDAIQDTFVKATISWKNKRPENPEAWLTAAAKNRVLDIFRKLNAEKRRLPKITMSMEAIALTELFLDAEIEDSQLRMIFTACHPSLDLKNQIAFSLKTVSGFSTKEIASALLTKEETIKKRLSRARKSIESDGIAFAIPSGKELPKRLDSVLEVLYLIFNEGFHSNQQGMIVRKDLCGEAIRLCKLLLRKNPLRVSRAYALLALMCFHAARLDSKVDANGEIIDLKNQDRNQWHFPFVQLGNEAMTKAVESEPYDHYHYEAAIAAEHLKASSFERTDWKKILMWYECLYLIKPSAMTALNMAVVQLQRACYKDAYTRLLTIEPVQLEQRAYLYYGTMAEYYSQIGEVKKALASIELALTTVSNEAEKKYLLRRKELI